jgi:hypothetical protein
VSGTLSDMMTRALWRQLMQQNTSGGGFQGWSPGAGFGLPGRAGPQAAGAGAPVQQTAFGAGAPPAMHPAMAQQGVGSVIDYGANQALYGTSDLMKLGTLGAFGFPVAYDPGMLARITRRRGGVLGFGGEGNQAGDHAGDPSGPEGPGGGGLG